MKKLTIKKIGELLVYLTIAFSVIFTINVIIYHLFGQMLFTLGEIEGFLFLLLSTSSFLDVLICDFSIISNIVIIVLKLYCLRFVNKTDNIIFLMLIVWINALIPVAYVGYLLILLSKILEKYKDENKSLKIPKIIIIITIAIMPFLIFMELMINLQFVK